MTEHNKEKKINFPVDLFKIDEFIAFSMKKIQILAKLNHGIESFEEPGRGGHNTRSDTKFPGQRFVCSL